MLETRWGARLEERIALSEARMESKLAALEGRLDSGLASVAGPLDSEVAALDGRVSPGFASLRAEVASQMRDQMKWMFVFWIGTLVPLGGLIIALGKNWL